MSKVLGYSVYLNEEQNAKYNEAYSIKSELVENAQKTTEVYGTGLDVILVLYIFETNPGDFKEFRSNKINAKTSKYNKKDKSIRVTFFIPFDEFNSKSTIGQLAYYYRTTIEALLMVKDKFAKGKETDVNFDFDKLIEDVKRGYLNIYSDLDD